LQIDKKSKNSNFLRNAYYIGKGLPILLNLIKSGTIFFSGRNNAAQNGEDMVDSDLLNHQEEAVYLLL